MCTGNCGEVEIVASFTDFLNQKNSVFAKMSSSAPRTFWSSNLSFNEAILLLALNRFVDTTKEYNGPYNCESVVQNW